MDEFESVRKLIALKRYETPGEEYFERFLDEFHQRQRAELVKVPAHRLLLDRCEAWLQGWNGGRWLLAGAMGAVVAVLTLLSLPEAAPKALQAEAAFSEPAPVSLLREF